MKKTLLSLVIVLICSLAGLQSNAQSKMGYFDAQDILPFMPGIGKVDTLLNTYRTDSLGKAYNALTQEYTYKDSMLNKTDQSKIPASVKSQLETDLAKLTYQLNNWQGYAQQALQAKQNELLQPYLVKISDALKSVSKKNNITYVFVKDALISAPPEDDMILKVAAELGIKLPPPQK